MFSFAANKPQQTSLSTSTSQPNFFGATSTPASQAIGGAGAGAATTGGGIFSFNTSSNQQQPGGVFGSSFAAKPQTAVSSLGSGGGGFGGTSGGFGLNKPSTLSAFGGQTTTIAATGGPFGAPGSFGTTTSSTPSLFGPVAARAPMTTTTSTGFGGFGNAATSQQSSVFGGGPLSTQPAGSIFSLGASKPATTSTTGSGIFGGFSQPATTTSTLSGPFGTVAPSHAQPAAAQFTEQDVPLNSLVNPQVFNDERDAIIAKWNQLQALSGLGKIFYQNAAVDVFKENLFNRFKTIGYICRSNNKNEDGLIGLIINKKESDVRADQKTIVAALHKIFNSDPSLSIVIDTIKPFSDDKTEVTFYVNQRVSQLTDQTSRVLATLVYQHLNKQEAPPTGLLGGLKTSPTIKQQLEQIGVASVYPLVGMNDDQLKAYLDNVPNGLNPVLWDQAKKSNPNPKKLIPVQIIGFQEINKRFKLQDEENKAQKNSLTAISNSIESLNHRTKILRSKIDQFKARNDDLEQRTLKVMINYEIRRKLGLPLQENEKYLLGLLESIQMELSSPINKEIQRQKLNEFDDILKSLENRKTQQQQQPPDTATTSTATANEPSIATLTDSSSMTDIYMSMHEQQKALKSLIEMIQKDNKDLELMRKYMLNEK